MSKPAEFEHDLFIAYAPADREWVQGYLFDTLKQASVHYHHEAAFALGDRGYFYAQTQLRPRLAAFRQQHVDDLP